MKKFLVDILSEHSLSEVVETVIVEAECESAVRAWFFLHEKFVNVHPADDNDAASITILKNFQPYINAVRSVSAIMEMTNGMACRFYVMDEAYYNNLAFPKLSSDNNGSPLRIGDWYVIVACPNGYLYYINVTHDSVLAMCAEVFCFIQYK